MIRIGVAILGNTVGNSTIDNAEIKTPALAGVFVNTYVAVTAAPS
jgi:hypothetical protein